jgi:undecaprenyl diphosphate synthase
MHSKEKVPQHIAIIMDGNGRWAKQKGKPRIEGHRAGIHVVREIVRVCGELGVKFLTLYSFSIENWSRPRQEVQALMLLLKRFLRSELKELMSSDVRFMAIGRIKDLPKAVQDELASVTEKTKDNRGLTLVLALSYGGRAEITDAVKEIAVQAAGEKISPDDINEEMISRHLYTRQIPDPDLLIRTSGEMRVSNFLLWQISYAEIWVTQTLWPDFNRSELNLAIEEFQKRERRFGALSHV